MNAARSLSSRASVPLPEEVANQHVVTGPRWRPTAWRRMLASAGLYGLLCLFFGVVAISGGRESTLGADSAVVFLTLRLLGAGIGFWKLR